MIDARFRALAALAQRKFGDLTKYRGVAGARGPELMPGHGRPCMLCEAPISVNPAILEAAGPGDVLVVCFEPCAQVLAVLSPTKTTVTVPDADLARVQALRPDLSREEIVRWAIRTIDGPGRKR